MSQSRCEIHAYTRILQNLIWRNMTRSDRIVVFILNLAFCFPGLMYYISSVYDDDSRTTVKFEGRQTSFTFIFFITTLVIIPLINFINQSFIQKFRFALRLSQTALFCAIINSLFYIASLFDRTKELTRKYLPTRTKGLSFFIICVVFILILYTIVNPEFDTVLDLSDEVKKCKKDHPDIKSLRRKAQSDDILNKDDDAKTKDQ